MAVLKPLHRRVEGDSGDTLSWRQYQTGGACGGIDIDTSGGNTSWSVYDQNGILSNSDCLRGQWESRTIRLNGYAGSSINTISVGLDGGTSGPSTIDVADAAISSTDGSVHTVFNGQPLNLTLWGGPMPAQASFVDTPAIEPGSYAIHYLLGDHLGTAQMEFSSVGYPVWKGEFAPFGQELSDPNSTVNHYKFTGNERDTESGLDYFKYRMYSSNAGRWMSPDPSGLTHVDLGNPQSLNLYNYVGNSPLTRADLDGLCWKGFQWACDIGQRFKNSINYGFITDKQVDAKVKQGQDNLRNHGVSAEGLSRVAIAGAAGRFGKTWQTYIKRHPNLGPYSGRTSGTGTPEQNLLRRDANHHMNEQGYGEAELDKSSSNPDAIRGRAQQNIEANGGARSQGGTSGNAINEISESNPNRSRYMSAAEAEFGTEGVESEVEGAITAIEIMNDIPD